MKYFLFALSLFLFVSCNSDDTTEVIDYSAENEQQIQEYLEQHNLTATRTNSGLHYIITEQGTGDQPTYNSDVSVRYKAYLLDGTEIDDSYDEIISFNLVNVISGFAEGIQYFNEGGSGLLFIPAHLAYGSRGSGSVPPGAVVVFEVELVDYEVENEEEIIAYLESEQITDAIRSDTGLYYIIDEEGQGENPTSTSNVTVKYTAYFTDGEIFDQSGDEGVTFNLSQVIAGWQEGIQYFKENGKGTLIIPSHLGYGIYDYNGIPGGSVLIFDIELLAIN
ncbi:hypothetical protein KH5_07890 [Urechidicola sp. KH5]